MNAQAVIARELRQQSRRSAATWMRVAAAFIAGSAALAFLGGTPVGRQGGLMPGQIVFTGLSVFVFVFCLFEGVRQTSDALASEKREGTLGLLLLTDLTSLEVVLGKLVAGSLSSAYALLAVFPALSMALPYGGVTAGEFWRVQLALLAALLVALAIGLWASAGEREARHALIKGLATVALITLVPALIDVFLRHGSLPNVSPAVGLYLAQASVYPGEALRFWLTLLAMFALACGFLVLAGRRLLRSWQDEERTATLAELNPTPPQERWAPEGEPVWTEDLASYHFSLRSARPSREQLNHDPAAWLAAWVPEHRFLAGTAIVLLALGLFGGVALSPFFGATIMGAGPAVILWLSSLIPWLFLAYVACRPLAEARRSGALELLLSTPMGPAEIVRAHWKALWNQFRGPFTAVCVLLVVFLLFAIAIALTDGRSPGGFSAPLSGLLGAFSRVVLGLAVCRLGLYFGLKARTTPGAILQTLLVSVGATSFGSIALAELLSFLLPGGANSHWTCRLFVETTSLGYGVFLFRWAHLRLVARFRELASEH